MRNEKGEMQLENIFMSQLVWKLSKETLRPTVLVKEKNRKRKGLQSGYVVALKAFVQFADYFHSPLAFVIMFYNVVYRQRNDGTRISIYYSLGPQS